MTITRNAVVLGFLLAAVPVASAACFPSCEVGSTAFGYAPPITTIESGDNVTWTSADLISHTATSDLSNRCLHAVISADEPGRAFFRVENDTLRVATDPNGTWKTCTEAVALPEGAFALAYRCLFHSPQQQGVVVVTA